ncbi:MAG: TauD/TfdA family dioxygenase [Rhizobiaceae bacterium]
MRLTATESEPFDELQRLAKSEEFYLDMNFQKGDMQFLNNRVTLHGCTDYEDPEEVSKRRHMLRLRLNVRSGRAGRPTRSLPISPSSARGSAGAPPAWICPAPISQRSLACSRSA